jgi:hypothetical protein
MLNRPLLITTLVPQARRYFDDDHALDLPSPQSVAISSPTDYWQRLVDGHIGEETVTDQRVLKEIEGSKSAEGRETLAHSLFENNRFAEIWEHFSNRLPEVVILPLVRRIVELELERKGAESADCNGLNAVWRSTHRRVRRDSDTVIFMLELLKMVLPQSIGLWNDLAYLWAQGDGSILGPDQEAILWDDEVLKVARDAFTPENPKALAGALGISPAAKTGLLHLVLPARSQRLPPPETSSRWAWLAPVILEAAKVAPDKIVLQLVPLLRGSLPEGQISDVLLSCMFGERTRDVLELISRSTPMGEERDHRELSLMRAEATRLLDKMSQSGARSRGGEELERVRDEVEDQRPEGWARGQKVLRNPPISS